jgi:protein-S-isoprenylcysteine O-methyltransferase Ste14
MLKLILPIYLLVFFIAGFLWRSYIVWRHTGINPYKLGSTDTAHDFIGRLFRLVMIVLLVVTIVYSLLPTLYEYFVPIPWLNHPLMSRMGLGLLIVALVWVITAQAQMGDSWRIGVDKEHSTTLVTGGLFRYSRNPIFLGMRIMLLGLLLVLPNAILLVIWVLGDVLMQIQVRLEEEHLTQLHGLTYQKYRQRVRRWI